MISVRVISVFGSLLWSRNPFSAQLRGMFKLVSDPTYAERTARGFPFLGVSHLVICALPSLRRNSTWPLLAAIFEMSFTTSIAAPVFLRRVVAIPFDDSRGLVSLGRIFERLWLKRDGRFLDCLGNAKRGLCSRKNRLCSLAVREGDGCV
jgi:hypothetical protein